MANVTDYAFPTVKQYLLPGHCSLEIVDHQLRYTTTLPSGLRENGPVPAQWVSFYPLDVGTRQSASLVHVLTCIIRWAVLSSCPTLNDDMYAMCNFNAVDPGLLKTIGLDLSNGALNCRPHLLSMTGQSRTCYTITASCARSITSIVLLSEVF